MDTLEPRCEDAFAALCFRPVALGATEGDNRCTAGVPCKSALLGRSAETFCADTSWLYVTSLISSLASRSSESGRSASQASPHLGWVTASRAAPMRPPEKAGEQGCTSERFPSLSHLPSTNTFLSIGTTSVGSESGTASRRLQQLDPKLSVPIQH